MAYEQWEIWKRGFPDEIVSLLSNEGQARMAVKVLSKDGNKYYYKSRCWNG